MRRAAGLFIVLTMIARSARAFPIAAAGTEGLRVIVTNDNPVVTTYQGNSANYSDDLYLMLDASGQPGDDGNLANDLLIFNNHGSAVGSQVTLGSFMAGTELRFRLYVHNTGYQFYTGPAERNPDGHSHARVQGHWRQNETLVSFEDLYNGPFDYNDLSFSFSNTGSVTCPADVAQVGVPYSSMLEPLGLTAPYSFSTETSLPAGLVLDATTGTIAGTPTEAGAVMFTAQVLDAAAVSASSDCIITVLPVPTSTPTASASQTPTTTPTATLTRTSTATVTPSATATLSPTASRSPTATISATRSATATPSASLPATFTATGTATSTPSAASTPTAAATSTPTPASVASHTATASPVATGLPPATATPSASAVPTATRATGAAAGIYVASTAFSFQFITAYPLASNGTVEAVLALGGVHSGIYSGAAGVAVDAEGNIYSANYGSVTVHAPGSTGDQPPRFTIAGPHTGLKGAVAIALDAAGTIYVANENGGPYGSGSVTIYPPGSDGDVAPSATIHGESTGLNMWQPQGVAVGPDGSIYIVNANSGYGQLQNVSVYGPGSEGNATPKSVITHLVGADASPSPKGIAIDAGGNVYVVNASGGPDVSFPSMITVYPAGSDGLTLPTAVITGANTGLYSPRGIALDADGNMYVTSINNSVRVFAAGSNGNVAPVAAFTDPMTWGYGEPYAIAIGPLVVVTATATPTATGFPTFSPTVTTTPSASETVTASPTASASRRVTLAPTGTATATTVPSPMATTAVPSATPSASATAPLSGSPTPSHTATPTAPATRTPPPTARTLVGDCSGRSRVSISDIVTLVNIALGNLPASACPHGIPSGASVDISVIIEAVLNALNG
jgi:sugar lactone lactonase YvrE